MINESNYVEQNKSDMISVMTTQKKINTTVSMIAGILLHDSLGSNDQNEDIF